MTVDRIRLDLSRIESIDVASLKVDLPALPRRRSGGRAGRGTRWAAAMIPGSAGDMIEDIVSLSNQSAPRLEIRGRPTSYAAPTPGIDVTAGLGVTGSAAAVMGVTAGAGVYGSTTPEIGFYGTVGGGWWTNVTASAGGEFTFVFGPPSSFGGACWGVGADISFSPGAGVGLGGMILFTPPPVRFLGFSVSLTYGISVIPVDITVQTAYTWTRPIWRP